MQKPRESDTTELQLVDDTLPIDSSFLIASTSADLAAATPAQSLTRDFALARPSTSTGRSAASWATDGLSASASGADAVRHAHPTHMNASVERAKEQHTTAIVEATCAC